MVLSSIQTSRNRARNQKALFVAHDECPGLLCLFLDRLGGLAGLLGCACGIPGSLTGALGGSVFLFDGLFLLPAGNGVAGKLRIFPQGLLIQGVYIGLLQLLLGLGGLAVGLQLVACGSPPEPTVRRSQQPPRTCGRSPRPHCPVRSPGFPCELSPGRHWQGYPAPHGTAWRAASSCPPAPAWWSLCRFPGPPSFAGPAF